MFIFCVQTLTYCSLLLGYPLSRLALELLVFYLLIQMEANDSSAAIYSQVESAEAINISMFEDTLPLKTHKKQSRSLVLNFNSRN